MIRRLLVANRGEIARRVFATCRLVGIETVAVYSDADADAPHVTEADYAVHLSGGTPESTYLRGDLIIAAAKRAGVNAAVFVMSNRGYGMFIHTSTPVTLGDLPGGQAEWAQDRLFYGSSEHLWRRLRWFPDWEE